MVKKVVIKIFLLLFVFILWGCSNGNQGGTTGKTGSMNDVVADAQAQIASQEEKPDNQERTLQKLSSSQIMTKVNDSVYLDGVHNRKGVTCEKCHGEIKDNAVVELPKDDVCMKCHEGSYEKLSDKLQIKEQWKTYNPHNPHDREACISCHHLHGTFELTCKSCHTTASSDRLR